MKRNSLVLGFIFILLGGLLPRGAQALAGPPEFAEIFRHKASATSILARLKDPGNVAMINQTDQIRRAPPR
jgi:hypothetical protein